MRGMLHSVSALAVLVLMLLAMDEPSAAQQTPPPEFKELNDFVGTWTIGERGTQTCSWFGEFFLRCETKLANETGLDVFSYNPSEGAYTWHRFYTGGYGNVAKGFKDGNTWTWLYDVPVADQYRMTMVLESPTLMTVTQERSVRGGAWETTMQVTRTTKAQR